MMSFHKLRHYRAKGEVQRSKTKDQRPASGSIASFLYFMLKERSNSSPFLLEDNSMFQRAFAAEPCRRLWILHRTFLLGVVLTLTALTSALNAQTRLLRTPSVSSTQIAFAYANNIWTVPRNGGSARRLTSFQGQTLNPQFSPDGKWIAFSGEYAGNLDVYVIPAEGGEPRRLTWHPRADQA